MEKIAFIGVGVMGQSMVRNLHHAGYQVSIYTCTKAKVETLLQEGITWHETIASCVKGQNIVMTMVGYPDDVKDVYYNENGILQNAAPQTICIDFTTSEPALAQKIYQDAKAYHIHVLDAPVSGGDIGAKNATLSIMVGGEQEIFNKVLPLFEVLGNSIHYVGSAGLGQHTKMANQIAIAGTIAGVSEAIHYAQSVHLDTDILMQCIAHGAAGSWQLTHNGQAILEQDFKPGFYIKHFIKDMKIAKNEMRKRDKQLEVMNQVLSMYEQLDEDEHGTQALIHYYQHSKD